MNSNDIHKYISGLESALAEATAWEKHAEDAMRRARLAEDKVAELERERQDYDERIEAIDALKDKALAELNVANEELDKALAELAAEREKPKQHHNECLFCGTRFSAIYDKCPVCAARAEAAQWKERAEKAEESQRLTQKAREDDRGRLQQKCSDWGTYWRASDAHGVELNIAQATELLADALGVEVEIKARKD